MRLTTWTRQILEILRHHDVQQLRVSKSSMARDILEKLAVTVTSSRGVGKLDVIVKPLAQRWVSAFVFFSIASRMRPRSFLIPA